MTNFSISKKAFQNSDIVNLGDLEFVERSNKIRVEKLLNGPSQMYRVALTFAQGR
jgi:hypothetical protein